MILFVYGTLMNAQVAHSFLDREPEMYSAEVPGYKIIGLNIIKYTGASASGFKLEVSESEMKMLDAYEGVVDKLYKRIQIKLKDGTEAVAYQKCNPDIKINFE